MKVDDLTHSDASQVGQFPGWGAPLPERSKDWKDVHKPPTASAHPQSAMTLSCSNCEGGDETSQELPYHQIEGVIARL